MTSFCHWGHSDSEWGRYSTTKSFLIKNCDGNTSNLLTGWQQKSWKWVYVSLRGSIKQEEQESSPQILGEGPSLHCHGERQCSMKAMYSHNIAARYTDFINGGARKVNWLVYMAMRAVSDRPGIHDQDFLASYSVVSLLARGSLCGCSNIPYRDSHARGGAQSHWRTEHFLCQEADFSWKLRAIGNLWWEAHICFFHPGMSGA